MTAMTLSLCQDFLLPHILYQNRAASTLSLEERLPCSVAFPKQQSLPR